VAAGEVNDTVDAGYYFDPSFSEGATGRAWSDDNGNGLQDPGEEGIDGVVVNLYFTGAGAPTLIASTTSAGGGFYELQGLPGETHFVELISPPGMEPTDRDVGDDTIDSDVGSDGRSAPFPLSGGEIVTVDAGFVLTP